MALVSDLKRCLKDITIFSQSLSQVTLRSYQQAAAQSIVHSVLARLGLSFVIMFPRQSGKNELQAQIEAYLLTILQLRDTEIVKVSPTWKPQSLNAMRRLERVLDANLLTHGQWHKESGYIYCLGKARITFLSGQPESNIVGATASTLLEVDEAQDIQIAKFDKDIAPMAASTNATRVFYGTAWTSQTLLARELRHARAAQESDGIQRLFVIDAEAVSQEIPAYGKFVAAQIAVMGRQHPIIKTQFFCEEIEAQGGMFPPQRIALLKGNHPPQLAPIRNHLYAFLIDVAGSDEAASTLGASSANVQILADTPPSSRDSTALTILEVDLSSLGDPLIQRPVYKVVNRHEWINVSQSALYALLRAQADLWNPTHIVIDATGIGAGLASFLDTAYPGKVTPFIFTVASKSKLGWDFLAIIETGRFKEYRPDPSGDPSLTILHHRFITQLENTLHEVSSDLNHTLKWAVPEGTVDSATGVTVHDDLVISAALAAVLDGKPWGLGQSVIIPPREADTFIMRNSFRDDW